LSGVLSYSIKNGINQDDLQPDSRFWAEKDAIKEEAVVRAVDRIIELEEERIQASVAKKVAQQVKDAPLAMSDWGGEKKIANLRKRTSDLAEATALARSIADQEAFVGKDAKGVPYSRKSQWRTWDVWHPGKGDPSPTHQLLENEALLADAKLRDIYVYKTSRGLQQKAREDYREVLNSDLSTEDKAEQFKSIHQAMMQAMKQMEATATGSQDDLFKAIKRDIEGRRDSSKARCQGKRQESG
jgi:hypothetical protein